MIRAFHATFLIAALVQGGTHGPPGGASSTVEGLIRQSTYIFKGQVEKLHASNLKILPATDRTALVRVQQGLYAPRSMGDFTGQVITIELAEPGGLKAGERAIFFTNGWLYGESLAVKEVGHSSAESKEVSAKAIEEVQRRIEDEKIQTRIRLAAAVIVGKVATTKPFKGQGKMGPPSEHDPDWQVAEIELESILKGTPPKTRVAVLYPNSKDVMWFSAPRFQQGQQGVWILQAAKDEEEAEKVIPDLGGPAYVALDPLDFRPTSEAARIRRLIAGQEQ
jgi:hypothetical protein